MFTTVSGMISCVLYAMLLVHGQFDPSSATKSDCYKVSADIVFVVDSSFSIRDDDYDRQLTFLRALVDKFTIGQNNIQVGVVSFSSEIRMDIKLNDYDNSRDLQVAISRIKQLKEGTETREAIHFVHTVMYEFVNGGRPWARKMMIFITDGVSSDVSATIYEASVARSKGIEIFSVLVGANQKDFETLGIASEPKDQHMFKVENFRAFAGIERSLSSAACQSSGSGIEDTDENHKGGSTDTASNACHKSVADVVFLMDSSNSIWSVHFRDQIRFIQQVVSSFDISEDATRVAVIDYTNTPIILVGFTDKQTHDHVNLALANAPYITGTTTNTASAIKEARKLLTNSNSRPNTAQVIIILSDGHSENAKETIAEASRAHSENVYVFAIGIGNETEPFELMAVASDPNDKFVFHVDNYKALSEINELVAVKTCDVSSMMAQGDQSVSCPESPTDVVFIYDKVALSIHHHDYVISVISEFMDPHRLNNQELRVGVIREPESESDSAVHDIALTNEWIQPDFKLQLDPDSTTSSIDELLKRARLRYFSPLLQLSHSSHTKTIVLFLDSALSDLHAATIEARRLKKNHVNVVTINLGKNTNRREALGLASAPNDDFVINVPSVADYPEHEVVSRLLRILCQSTHNTKQYVH